MPAEARSFQELQQEMTAWLREPEQELAPAIEPRRLAIYRELVFNNISDFVETAYPVLKSLLPLPEWAHLLERFVAEHYSQSPYFRDISLAFREWMEARRTQWLAQRPWAQELMHFEWVQLAADCAETAPDTTACQPDGDLLAGIPCLRSALWPLLYRWPVHALSVDNPPTSEPPAQPTCLLGWRDDEDALHFVEVNPLSAHLVEIIQSRASREAVSGRVILQALAAEAGYSTEAAVSAFVAAGAGLLEELRVLGIVRGARLGAV
jgi:hypothetical protein